ncbi:hypothetical protein BST29_03305 [Mycobacterium malmoense]|uniref:Uncharacterized protein n=1 Tax=Mycobacterium malmoense TaxID=1780 RepID=A0ABX3SZQ5_MYCMA|nr:hypothetical protein BMG05_06645 [Mycobacterium malmoense]ORA85222.1 hypothetical protein BST29_03305 [Mycobacterium malmoense]
MRSRGALSVLAALLLWLGVGPAGADVSACQPAELFATDSTDPLFELQADVTIAQTGVTVTGSTPLDGVFWSNKLRQITFERSREFHLCGADGSLHTAAEALRRQFNQEAVLIFDYLPRNAPEANAIAITVPDVDVARFRDAFVADAAAHQRLHGGSVTITDHTLILVAGNGDLDVARRLVDEAGGNWNAVAIAHGRREFVE